MTPDPLPLLDEAAVAAMAKRAYEEATRALWSEIPEEAKRSWRNVARRDLAAYFAALDREAMTTLTVCTRSGQLPYECGLIACENGCETHDLTFLRLGLFNPDTEEQTLATH
jgi:hypothetical protein